MINRRGVIYFVKLQVLDIMSMAVESFVMLT